MATALSSLPFELLELIAEKSIVRHPSDGHVLSTGDLAALSAVCSTFYEIVKPLLLQGVAITSEKQLFEVSLLHRDDLSRIKALSIFLDVPFFYSFTFWGFLRGGSGPPGASSPFDALATILAATKNLSILRIRVATLNGPSSAWSIQSANGQSFAVPFSPALFRSKNIIELHKLHTLELDGFSDIGGLLGATPALQVLRLRLSGGFSREHGVGLISAIKAVPNLRELVYTTTDLRIAPSTHDTAVAAGDEAVFLWGGAAMVGGNMENSVPIVDDPSSVAFLTALASAVPNLEVLDLETRLYCMNRVDWRSSGEIVPSSALVTALSGFPKLRHISLPLTVMSPEESDNHFLSLNLLRASISSTLFLVDERAQLALDDAHNRMLRHIVNTERDVLENTPQLESISFTRAGDAADGTERAITYRHERFCSSSVIVRETPRTALDGQYSPYSVPRPNLYVLMKRSLRRFLRQRSSVIGTASESDLTQSTSNKVDETERQAQSLRSYAPYSVPRRSHDPNLILSVVLAALGGSLLGKAPGSEEEYVLCVSLSCAVASKLPQFMRAFVSGGLAAAVAASIL